MLSIEEFKKHLSEECKGWSEEKIEKLRADMDKMADIFFDMWLEKRNKEKNEKKG